MRKIKQIGKVSIYWNAEYQEYICKVENQPELDYYTLDLADAIETAKCM